MTLTLDLLPLINLNPFDWLGDKAKEGLAEGWTAVMISIWSAGLWLLEAVFKLLDRFLTPDLTDPGLVSLHGITLWISLAVALVVGLGQIGLAALRRDGTSLATLLIGLAQYGAVATCWVAVFAALVLASAGLTTGLLSGILDIDGFAGYPAGAGWPDQVGGTVAATVLGLCSLLLLIPAGFGYLVIMLVREGALLILTATAPIAAAGSLGTGSRAWLWKSLRWFLAACLTAPLLALVLGLGVQITRAAFPDDPTAASPQQPSGSRSDTENRTVGDPALTSPLAPPAESPAEPPAGPSGGSTAGSSVGPASAATESSQVGMAVVGAAIMVVGCFCPMALFRLLAFVDPGTGSGASLRSTLHANGGVGGLFTRGQRSDPEPDTATQTAPDGRAASEQAADAETGNRFQTAAARAVPVAGQGVAGTMRLLGGLAQKAASVGVDVAGQAGIGATGYYDAGTRATTNSPTHARAAARGPASSGTGQGADPGSAAGPTPGPADHGDATTPAAAEPDDGVAGHPRPPAAPPASGAAKGPLSGQAGAAGVADDAVFLA